MAWIKYKVEKHQVYSNGQWVDIEPLETRLSDPLGTYDTLEECYRGKIPQYKWIDNTELEPICDECFEPMYRWHQLPDDDYICDGQAPMYRWVSDSGTMCVGFDKYNRDIKQVSTDGGYTWTNVDPPVYTATTIAVKNSIDCGYIPEYGTYLTFEAIDSGSFGLRPVALYATDRPVQYSLDSGSTWTTIYSGGTTPTVSAGQKVMWKGGNFGYGIAFTSTGRFNVEGNVMSLRYDDSYSSRTDLADRSFVSLFSSCKVVNAEKLYLPSTTMKEDCYLRMFYGCSGLTTAPVLPATTLAEGCYEGMFDGCTSLAQAPALPATTMARDCYYSMFSHCTSLTTAPVLPATTLAYECYRTMFYGCTSLTTPPALPATTMADYCYYGMFGFCTSLTTAPVLPATVLTEDCYGSMFYGCTSLTTAPALPATTVAPYCYTEMFSGCTSLTTAPSVLPATTLHKWCYYRMFSGCSGLTTAPEISATTVSSGCCQEAFRGCTSLTKAPSVLPATTMEFQCYHYMFYGCTSLTTAPVMSATTLASGCCGSMFNGCTSLTVAPVLYATTLVGDCYRYMFNNCSSLRYIKCLATNPSTSYTENWVKGVASSGTFVKDANTTWTTGVNGRPNGWTVQNA